MTCPVHNTWASPHSTYHQLGILAQNRGDHDEAERQNQRSLDISERLGNHVDAARARCARRVTRASRP